MGVAGVFLVLAGWHFAMRLIMIVPVSFLVGASHLDGTHLSMIVAILLRALIPIASGDGDYRDDEYRRDDLWLDPQVREAD
ncbi:MAG: hypothetical protein KJZ69_15920 [Phycisphaerales bacterium]|nr:hypothetical protein [Phycisphaerales bacterium]